MKNVFVAVYGTEGFESEETHPLRDAVKILQKITHLAYREGNPNFGKTHDEYWQTHLHLEKSLKSGNTVGVDLLNDISWRFKVV